MLNRAFVFCLVLAVTAGAADPTAPDATLIVGCSENMLQFSSTCARAPCFLITVQVEAGTASRCVPFGAMPGPCVSGAATVSFDRPIEPSSSEVSGKATLTFGKEAASTRRFRALVRRRRC